MGTVKLSNNGFDSHAYHELRFSKSGVFHIRSTVFQIGSKEKSHKHSEINFFSNSERAAYKAYWNIEEVIKEVTNVFGNEVPGLSDYIEKTLKENFLYYRDEKEFFRRKNLCPTDFMYSGNEVKK